LDNTGFPAIYLGPSEDHKRDTYIVWNPKTKRSIEFQSAVFLQTTYGDFHKLDESEIALQLTAITDELTKMLTLMKMLLQLMKMELIYQIKHL
jgi:hypothetical protein